MPEYTNIAIDIVENGYCVSVCAPEILGRKRFIFPDIISMNEWIKENLSTTGVESEFIEGLG